MVKVILAYLKAVDVLHYLLHLLTSINECNYDKINVLLGTIRFPPKTTKSSLFSPGCTSLISMPIFVSGDGAVSGDWVVQSLPVGVPADSRLGLLIWPACTDDTTLCGALVVLLALYKGDELADDVSGCDVTWMFKLGDERLECCRKLCEKRELCLKLRVVTVVR